jgi:hypothetical protein
MVSIVFVMCKPKNKTCRDAKKVSSDRAVQDSIKKLKKEILAQDSALWERTRRIVPIKKRNP